MPTQPLSINELREHAENEAQRLQEWAKRLFILTLVFDGVGALVSAFLYKPQNQIELSWGIAVLSAFALLTALMLFVSRTVWNFSNVWLGRAGTLEDLMLILQLMEANGDGPVPAGKVDELKQLAEAFQLLRREFEGKLLEGPSVQLLGKSKD